MRNSTWLFMVAIMTAIIDFTSNNVTYELEHTLIIALFVSAYFICKTIEDK